MAGLVAAPVIGLAQTKIDKVIVGVDAKTIPVRVSGTTPELDQLANLAFNAHGRYLRVNKEGAQAFTLQFSPAGGNQVQVQITPRGSAATSQVVSGSSLRNALFRAADVAVERTSGLKGFFASKLAFVVETGNQGEIYTADLFFGETRQITHDRSQILKPRWAPDGNRILYTSYFRSGFPDIFLIDLASLQRTTFVSFKGTNMGARFSPNGQQVAMVLSGEGNPELYVSNAQGRAVSRRTRTAAIESSPCFSPDGSQIVYQSDSAGGPQLFILPTAGGTPRRLATNISGYCTEPDWSRGNPNLIAFTARIGSGYQIAVHDLSGKKATVQVSKSPGDAIDPAWLADGRHLVYTQRSGGKRIMLLDTETGRTTALSGPSSQVSQASVSGP